MRISYSDEINCKISRIPLAGMAPKEEKKVRRRKTLFRRGGRVDDRPVGNKRSREEKLNAFGVSIERTGRREGGESISDVPPVRV